MEARKEDEEKHGPGQAEKQLGFQIVRLGTDDRKIGFIGRKTESRPVEGPNRSLPGTEVSQRPGLEPHGVAAGPQGFVPPGQPDVLFLQNGKMGFESVPIVLQPGHFGEAGGAKKNLQEAEGHR
jgi:hypothetical protein